MKNSKLMLMVIAGLSMGLATQASDENLPRFSKEDCYQAVRNLKTSAISTWNGLVNEFTTPEEEVIVPSFLDRAKTQANELMTSVSTKAQKAMEVSSVKMTEASEYTKANPVVVGSVSAAVALSAAIACYAYTQYATEEDTAAENN